MLPHGQGLHESPSPVPRCCLAREGPFLTERTPSALDCFGHGCLFRLTTYRASDYTQPTGEFGDPLHHPQFLEWIGTLESASLLDAASQLHRDVCVMTSNLDIHVLDQYVLCLQGTASKILDATLGSREFPSAAVAGEPRARRAAVQMEAMGLWRPSMDPVGRP